MPDMMAFITPWLDPGSRTAAESPARKYPGPALSGTNRHVTSAERIRPSVGRWLTLGGGPLEDGGPFVAHLSSRVVQCKTPGLTLASQVQPSKLVSRIGTSCMVGTGSRT